MCQIITNSETNPFAAAEVTCRKRLRAEELAPTSTSSSVCSSPVSVAQLQSASPSTTAKRVKLETSTATHVSPRKMTTRRMVTSRSSSASGATVPTSTHSTAVMTQSTASRQLRADIHALQQQVTAMQSHVHDASAGVRQLRRLVAVLALQRHRPALVARFQQHQLEQQQTVSC